MKLERCWSNSQPQMPAPAHEMIIVNIFSTSADNMQGRAIFISFCIWMLSTSFGFAEKMLSGAELRAGLIEYLAEQGYDAQPAINPSRLVKSCNQPLRYTPYSVMSKLFRLRVRIPAAGSWLSAQRLGRITKNSLILRLKSR